MSPDCTWCDGIGVVDTEDCVECGGTGLIGSAPPLPPPSAPEKFTVTVLRHEDEHVFKNIVAFEIKDDCYCMIDDSDQRYIVPMSGDIMWIETVKQ